MVRKSLQQKSSAQKLIPSKKDLKQTSVRYAASPSREDQPDHTSPSRSSESSPADFARSSCSEESIRSGELGDSEDSHKPRGSKQKTPRKRRASQTRLRGLRDASSTKAVGKDRTRKARRDKHKKSPATTALTDHAAAKRDPLLDLETSSSENSEHELMRDASDTEFDTDLETRFPSPPSLYMDTTGRMRYMRVCDKMCVKACSIFLREAMSNSLNLMHYGMGPKDLMTLSVAFNDNTYITVLNISHNFIGAVGVQCLARGLRNNQHLSEINMSYCFLGREQDGATAVCSLLKYSFNINVLNLTHNCFITRDYQAFAELLLLPSRLRTLNLSDNDFGGYGGCAAFADALEKNKSLLVLKLELNPLQSVGAGMILEGVSRNTCLQYLTLNRTGIYGTACGSLLMLLQKNVTLRCLDLTQNHLTPTLPEVISIHNYLKQNETPMELKLY